LSPSVADELVGARARPVEIRIGDEAEVDHPIRIAIGGIGGGQIGAADQIGLARIAAAAIGLPGPDDQIGLPIIVDIPAEATAWPA
jgi:hypothetical protein